ncbi:MAG: DNA-3-methyladenine glycosylase family protein [Limisphaerales bacterium]
MNLHRTSVTIEDYDLDATLSSGQAFRWKLINGWWEGVISNHWVRLRTEDNTLFVETATPVTDWNWLRHYLQLDVNLREITKTFPEDEPMQASLQSCHGLRLLRQEPWECLASFICSSTKQIVQIQQIMAALCKTFGDPLPVPDGHSPAYSFPSAERLANLTEADLRACKMGFRAPYVLGTARAIVNGEVDLESLRKMELAQARDELLKFPGVGVKIADCVLLFGYGFDQAFPIDVWIMKAVQQLYFPKRRASIKRLRRFTETHFGPHAGYAQQYLFHYMRVKNRKRS